MRWWRRLTLRARLTVIGTVGLAVGLALGGLLINAVLHYVLIRSVDTSSRTTASDVAALVSQEHSASKSATQTIPAAGTSMVQVLAVDHHNVVVQEASPFADRLVPMLREPELTRARNGQVIEVPGESFGVDGDVRVVAQAVSNEDQQPRLVLVATPTLTVEQSAATVRNALLITYPLLLAGLATFTWWVVGWALRPVEGLRQGAAKISARGGGQYGRLPVPDAQDEVNRLAVTLNDMLERLDAARARQQAFVADAAHELRSPITSLRTQLEVADRLDEPAPAADLMADVDRLSRLVDDLLLLARADEGDPRLRLVEATDFGALAKQVVDGYGAARVTVSCECPGPVPVVGDPVALRRVVDNLVGNAVRHARTGVVVSLRRDTDAVELTVSDDGPGIPPADRERVFDRFTRLDNSRARDDDGGAGLGLAIVRELLRLHNGSIVLGDADPGLRADVRLPAADAVPDAGVDAAPARQET